MCVFVLVAGHVAKAELGVHDDLVRCHRSDFRNGAHIHAFANIRASTQGEFGAAGVEGCFARMFPYPISPLT